MPSPRSRFETACRVGAFALLGWLLGGSIVQSTTVRIERAAGADLGARLEGWTRSAPGTAIHVDLATTPEPWATAWLSALRRARHQVSWSGNPLAAAMSIEPVADPDGGVRIDVAAPASTTVAVRDDISTIDSVRVASLGGTVVSPAVVGSVVATVRGQNMAAPAPGTAGVRAVMVIGEAGWEGKFIVSALEERGWPVIARFRVAPNVDVTQGIAAALDTSRVSTVIALDSTISEAGAALERFVRSGGGLVLAGTAARARNVAALAPGSLGERTRPNVVSSDSAGPGTTGFYPVSALREDGVLLERRAGGVTMAARRVGLGRVIEIGYDDSWRWRMAGPPGSEEAHRTWWSRVIASVAYVPSSGGAIAAAGSPGSSAPLAALVGAVGPARRMNRAAPDGPMDRRILISIIMVLLIMEWGSRRMRGLR